MRVVRVIAPEGKRVVASKADCGFRFAANFKPVSKQVFSLKDETILPPPVSVLSLPLTITTMF